MALVSLKLHVIEIVVKVRCVLLIYHMPIYKFWRVINSAGNLSSKKLESMALGLLSNVQHMSCLLLLHILTSNKAVP